MIDDNAADARAGAREPGLIQTRGPKAAAGAVGRVGQVEPGACDRGRPGTIGARE
ncbi:hypothetical protein GCM10010498_38180 [Streptomyces cavourensis]|nr:hypothetical protein GCM10010498_38180 [Streptomyces cavourensis]